MHSESLIAWLYWNPERVVFTVPFIDRPVVWYGLWFVFGFIAAYLLLIPAFINKLAKTQILSDRDISNWPRLIQQLQDPANPVGQKLDRTSRYLLPRLSSNKLPDGAIRNSILTAINELHLTRTQLQELFPHSIYKLRDLAIYLMDRLTWFAIAGTIIGARLGHVLFYEWPYYSTHLGEIYKVWKGGLASHGGTLGVLIAAFIYQRTIRKRFPEISFIALADMVVVPTGFTCFCIRIGNFFNQEILGTMTNVPWAIIFGDAADGTPPVPRHPVQLYEALAYLLIFVFLYFLSKKQSVQNRPGLLTGLFFILTFGSRFFIEFFKVPIGLMIDESVIQTGQYLSIPFVIAGIVLCYYSLRGCTRASCTSVSTQRR